ncbi:MAG TPA: hypothetical protein VG675_12535 [Bryobacteraceae bacterium]|nr:hypothetical protein [Bryobacteraceae bacterium]
MKTDTATSTHELTTPRAAAVAGVIFALLLAIGLVIVRLAVPPYQTDAGVWLMDPKRRNAVRVAIQLVPFAGISFLWFMGVIRNRLGPLEDRFFATVFLSSGLLFVASLFVSAASCAALVESVAQGRPDLLKSDAYYLIRYLIGTIMNIFAIKMAGVFLASTSTIALRTGILPRWIALSGFVCAAVLLLIITNWPWIALLFPLWMLVVSTYMLLAELHSPRPQSMV